QWTIGATALLLLVPIPLQLMHLLAADLLWIAWILLAAELLADQAGRTSEAINFAASESNTSPAPSPRQPSTRDGDQAGLNGRGERSATYAAATPTTLLTQCEVSGCRRTGYP